MFKKKTINCKPLVHLGYKGLLFSLVFVFVLVLACVPASALTVKDGGESVVISNCTFNNPSFATYNSNGALLSVPDNDCNVGFQFDNQLSFSCVSFDPMGGSGSYFRTFIFEITLPYSADKQSLSFNVTCPYLGQTSSTTLASPNFSTNYNTSYIKTNGIVGNVEKTNDGNLYYNIQNVIGGSTLSVAVSFTSTTSWHVMQIYIENVVVSSVGNQDIIDNDNKNTDKLILNDKEMYEKEKSDIKDSGDSAVDGAENIPDKSEGFISAIGNLVTAMSYDGTDYSSWNMPAITLPAIPNVMSEKQLTSEQQIDFGIWINKIPKTLLTLIQNVLSLALIVYCFKQLYSTISYVLTMKGSNE